MSPAAYNPDTVVRACSSTHTPDAEWPLQPGVDAIFCRNVMIYFDKPTQRRLIERYAQLLAPGGLFFAGHAESLLDQGRWFRLRGQTVYELAR